MKINPDWNNINRVLILGCSGTGKSTLAKLIGKKFDLEVIHLDQYFHKPNWVPVDNVEFRNRVLNLIEKDRWVIDGNYTKTLPLRIPKADLIIFFDYSSYFCVYRILKRSFKSKLGFEKRTDLADGCYEKWIDPEFVKFVWNFKKTYIPLTYQILDESNFDKDKIFIFKKRSEAKKFIRKLKQ